MKRLLFIAAMMLGGCVCEEQATIVDYDWITCMTTFEGVDGETFEGLGYFGADGEVVTVNRCGDEDAWSIWLAC